MDKKEPKEPHLITLNMPGMPRVEYYLKNEVEEYVAYFRNSSDHLQMAVDDMSKLNGILHHKDMESDPVANKLGEFIVNRLGINLVAVESIHVERQEDGQITDIHIVFLPQPAEGVQNVGKRSIKERYKKIADSKEFKEAYDGKSIGEVMEIEDL